MEAEISVEEECAVIAAISIVKLYRDEVFEEWL